MQKEIIPMPTFEYRLSADHNDDSVYVRVDDVFDINILRIEEGIVIDERSLSRSREE
jgi:hypothetical protein